MSEIDEIKISKLGELPQLIRNMDVKTRVSQRRKQLLDLARPTRKRITPSDRLGIRGNKDWIEIEPKIHIFDDLDIVPTNSSYMEIHYQLCYTDTETGRVLRIYPELRMLTGDGSAKDHNSMEHKIIMGHVGELVKVPKYDIIEVFKKGELTKQTITKIDNSGNEELIEFALGTKRPSFPKDTTAERMKMCPGYKYKEEVDRNSKPRIKVESDDN